MLEHFFGSKTRLKLLQIFFHSPQKSFYLRELSRMIEIQLNAVRREIANLEEVGIIFQVPADDRDTSEHRTERSKYYKLHTGFLMFPELRALLLKAQLLEEKEFIEKIKTKGGLIRLFLLTGLFVEEDKAGTDLLLVGKLKPVVILRLIRDFEKVLGKAIRYTLMEEKEFKERQEIGDVFLYNIFQSKHISVVDEYHVV